MADEESSRAQDWLRGSPARRRVRIRADLESRGASPEFSQRVAELLAANTPEPGSEGYGAAIDGAVSAWEVQNRVAGSAARGRQEIEEIHRLMKGFAGELRKLEEGLRILSAYAQRMRGRASGDRDSTLH